jgi:hypothetical protein
MNRTVARSSIAAFLLTAVPALAQHGVVIGKSCTGPACVGENTNCQIFTGHADFFGDTIRIDEAFDVVDPSGAATRIPPVGNLPIVSVSGNTTCMAGGSLPCFIGPGGSILAGLPGDPNPGVVIFRSNYVIMPGDPSPLAHQGNVIIVDQCDAMGTMGCSGLSNTVQFSASVIITDCNDNDECTIDTCTVGECTYEDVICDDKNICTTDTCDPLTGCVFTPECDPAGGFFCDDGDECTVDICDELGCCQHEPLPCDDKNPCTTDTCDPAIGCVFTPECLTPSDCDDLDLCTNDICTPEGCCDHTPVPCDDKNVCTTDSCDPLTGCVNTPECTTPVDCADGNLCTDDVCTALGCCENPPTNCDDMNPCTTDTCNPATGCAHAPVPCDDGNECTTEMCDLDTGGCKVVDTVDCGPPGECCSFECNPDTGGCDPTPISGPCDDGDPCTTNDMCTGQCTCVGEPDPDCAVVPTVTGWGMLALCLVMGLGVVITTRRSARSV